MGAAFSQLLIENPFFVLGLPAECSRAEVEREGQKLLSMLTLGLKGAADYATPLGTFERTPEKVRAAMAELRDPTKRLFHEALASCRDAAPSNDDPPVAWPSAQEAFSLGQRRG